MAPIAAWSMAAEAYRLLLLHLGPFFRLAGGWMVCLLGCAVVRIAPWPETIGELLLLLTLACAAVGSAAFSVRWYRALLKDDEMPLHVPLTVGRQELDFLGYQSALMLVPGLPLLMLFLVLHADGWWAAASSLLHGTALDLMPVLRLVGGLALSLPLAVIACTVLPRLMIVLPAIAIDEPGPLLAPLWQASRGNTAALLSGWLASVLPLVGLWAMLWFELSGALGPLAAPIVEIIAYPFWFGALALSGGFLSCAYLQLAAEKPQDETRPEQEAPLPPSRLMRLPTEPSSARLR